MKLITGSKKLVLASKSKRRSSILTSCGIKHKVIPPAIKEVYPKNLNLIKNAVIHNARQKALSVSKGLKNSIVIGADTLVVCDGKVIGKPKNKNEARKLLKLFSGKRTLVYTGLCVLDSDSGRYRCGYEKSSLRTKRIKKDEIDLYLKHLAPYDKAGGFSIEGWGAFIFDDIRGSYFNILGLPMARLNELCKKLEKTRDSDHV